MKTRMLALAFVLPVLAVLAATPEEAAAARRAREQLLRFTPEAARRAMADLKANPKYDWAKHNPAVEALIAKLDFAKRALEKGTDAEKAEAVKLVEGYRAAMLANPILDFDKILCVHRRINGARGAFGGRGSGMTGLNAENHMVAPRTGFENEIGVLSNLRGTPVFTPLYKPADKTSIVRDLDLDFDASRILFTGYKGTNNLFGVYEISTDFSKLAKEMPYQTPALVSPEDGKYDIQWWDGCYLPNKDQVILLGTAAYQFLP